MIAGVGAADSPAKARVTSRSGTDPSENRNYESRVDKEFTRREAGDSAAWLSAWVGFAALLTGSVPGRTGPVSVRGLPVGVVVGGALKDLQGRPDLRLGRLQDRIPGRPGPGREGLA